MVHGFRDLSIAMEGQHRDGEGREGKKKVDGPSHSPGIWLHGIGEM